jgi:hypothetical protein
MSRVYRWLGLAALLLSLGYFVRFAVRNAGALPRMNWDAAALAGLAASILLYLVVVLLAGVSWLIFLRSVGEPGRPRAALAIFGVAQFGKYIPGNVAHLAGRVVLAVKAGFVRERVLAAMALEIAWAVLAGVSVASGALMLSGTHGWGAEVAAPSVVAMAAVAAAALCVPLVGAILLRRLPERLRASIPGLSEVQVPGVRPLVVCYIIGCLNMLLLGAIPVLLEVAVFGGNGGAYLNVAGVFALAWVAGFITPGAPAGLGVRDAIMVAGLSPVYGAGSALGVTVIMRLATSAGDALAFLAGMAARPAPAAGGPKPQAS